jgi:phosphotransferase system  glucose/maltose/N-acetylglucosamine-specific IIC component
MGRVNRSRILLGGLLAGLVIDTGEYLLHHLVFPDDWKKALQTLNPSLATKVPDDFVVLTAGGLILGTLTVWLYAAILPRYGPGARTAIRAALAVWIPGYFFGLLAMYLFDILPPVLALLSMAMGFVELACGALLGRLIYADATV